MAPSGDKEPGRVDGNGDPVDVRMVDASTASEASDGTDYRTVAPYPQPTQCTENPVMRSMFDVGAWSVSFPPSGWCDCDGSGALPGPDGLGLAPPGAAPAQRWPAT